MIRRPQPLKPFKHHSTMKSRDLREALKTVSQTSDESFLLPGKMRELNGLVTKINWIRKSSCIIQRRCCVIKIIYQTAIQRPRILFIFQRRLIIATSNFIKCALEAMFLFIFEQMKLEKGKDHISKKGKDHISKKGKDHI